LPSDLYYIAIINRSKLNNNNNLSRDVRYIKKQFGDGGRKIMTRARFPRGLQFDDIAPFSFDFVAKHFAPLKDLVTKNNR